MAGSQMTHGHGRQAKALPFLCFPPCCNSPLRTRSEFLGTFSIVQNLFPWRRGSGSMGQNADIPQSKLFPQPGVLAHMDRMGVAADRWLRRVDHVDYLVRRWLIPVRFEDPTRSTQLKELSVQHAGSSHIQQAIGQRLGAEY